MPSSWTDLDFELQAAGENTNLWGAPKLNNALSRINYAFAGYISIAITGDYSLTTVRPTTSMVTSDFTGRISMLKFTGTLSANSTITVPSVAMRFMIYNNTNKTLTFTTGSGATVAVETGDRIPVDCDGTNCLTLSYGAYTLKDYIAAQTASAGAVPGTTGHLGKFLKVTVDGSAPTWQQVAATDISGFSAAAAAVRAGTSTTAALTPGDTYNGLAEVPLTSASNIVALDMSTFINGYHLFTENTTFANPTNAKPGQTGYIRVQQHASSAKTGAFGTNWYRQGGSTIAFSTTLGGYDFIQYEVITSSYILFDLIKNPSH